jgi:hypothetical protein
VLHVDKYVVSTYQEYLVQVGSMYVCHFLNCGFSKNKKDAATKFEKTSTGVQVDRKLQNMARGSQNMGRGCIP